MPHLASIHIYPIKSTRATDVEASHVERQGLRRDRRWMLVNEKDEFISQRTAPRLATVEAVVQTYGLDVRAPEFGAISIEYPEVERHRRVHLWHDHVLAVEVEGRVNRWFSRVVGHACRLVYLDDPMGRPLRSNGAAANFVSFADAFPVLMTSADSLADLNGRLSVPIPMNRFRPNLVVSGFDAFDEDGWDEVRIGTVRFSVVRGCARCVVTTTDQQTGEQGKEPLRTLANFRKRDGKVYFGVNLIPLEKGEIRRDDEVEITRRKPPMPFDA